MKDLYEKFAYDYDEFGSIQVYGDYAFHPYTENSRRLIVVAKRTIAMD